MNILADALNNIQSLVKSELITLKQYVIENNGGFASETLSETYNLYAHIQPITPQEISLNTDSTLDTTEAYKFYFINKEAHLLNSLDLIDKQTRIEWDNKTLFAYSIKNWYRMNGWIAIYATIQNKKGVENG